jgi:dihydrolipoamide dehydrogenase
MTTDQSSTPDEQGRFDVVVIGGGPGGYVAALRAAQLGLRTAVVEKRGALGGTCLNVGCIPSKALLHSSERYAEATGHLDEHGIIFSSVELDVSRMMERKDKIVTGLTDGIAYLFDKKGVCYLRGAGRIAAPGQVAVEVEDGSSRLVEADQIVIATGSESTPLAGVDIDEKQIVSSTGALVLDSVPERMVVIGAGVIGLELGSVWSRLGAKVQIIEFLDHILPGMDREIAKLAQRIFKRQGLDFKLSSKVTRATRSDGGVVLDLEPSAGGDSSQVEADVVLVAIGRRPYTDGLGLDELGVARDEHGFIQIDAQFQTSIPGIYAIGDCVPGPMLAHKAEEDGVACVEIMAGQAGNVDYGKVPGVVYTWPEIAGVGKTQEELEAEGIPYLVGKFPFTANSRARSTGDTDGNVKILAHANSDRILGVHIVGPLAGDVLQEAVLALEFGATAEDLARTCHAHPGMGEALKEAALAVSGRALHI